MAKKKKLTEKAAAAELVPVNAGSQREAAQAEIKALKASVSFPQVVRHDGDYQAVADTLRKVETARKNIEGARRSVTRLLDAAKKGIMEWFAPMLDECDRWRDKGDVLMSDWREELARRAEEAREKEEKREAKRLAILRANEQKKLEEAKSREEKARVRAAYRGKKEDVSREQEARREAIVTERPKAAGVAIKKVWKFELEGDISEVPLDYIFKSLDRVCIMKEIQLQVAAGRPIPSIRGLRIWQEESSAVGGL